MENHTENREGESFVALDKPSNEPPGSLINLTTKAVLLMCSLQNPVIFSILTLVSEMPLNSIYNNFYSLDSNYDYIFIFYPGRKL